MIDLLTSNYVLLAIAIPCLTIAILFMWGDDLEKLVAERCRRIRAGRSSSFALSDGAKAKMSDSTLLHSNVNPPPPE